jgi:hypothetical protein
MFFKKVNKKSKIYSFKLEYLYIKCILYLDICLYNYFKEKKWAV